MDKTNVAVYDREWKWISEHKEPGDSMADGLERARIANEELEEENKRLRELIEEVSDESPEELDFGKGKEVRQPEEASLV